MGMTMTGLPEVTQKLTGFFDDFQEDLQMVAQVGAQEIVKSTLAGIGEDDQPFAPYSTRYKQLLDAVGGKVRNVVDLRGVFLKKGQQQRKYRSEKRRQAERAGRRAYLNVAFGTRNANGSISAVGFTAQTPETRPQQGTNDPRSEMSIDLINPLKTSADKIVIEYTPRENDYMVTAHQRGEGTSPKRVWFTARKQTVWNAMVEKLQHLVMARVQRFNGG